MCAHISAPAPGYNSFSSLSVGERDISQGEFITILQGNLFCLEAEVVRAENSIYLSVDLQPPKQGQSVWYGGLTASSPLHRCANEPK